jgi:hypothetical protein
MTWIEYCKTFIPQLNKSYLSRVGHQLNWCNLTTFTEKQQWLKIYDSTFLKTFCADKITLHDYIKAKLGTDICIPIIGVYHNPDEICFNELPKGIVIKCNHGSGYNIIIPPDISPDINSIKTKLNIWLGQDYSMKNGCEMHYKLIPHKILIEPYMNDGHPDLIDYKFYCIHGKVIFCQVVTDRHHGEHISHYTDNWTYAPEYDWVEFDSCDNLEKPLYYTDMYAISEVLSKDFPLCRVDFYIISGQLYLGELTFTPNSGWHRFKNKDTDKELGKLLRIG